MAIIDAILTYRFMQNALLAALLAGVLCGLVGVIIVEKRLVMMTGGVAHTAYGGVGLGYLCGFSPLLGASLFAVLASFGISTLRRRGGNKTEVLISLFWALGMAVGMMFVAFTPGYPPDINSFLFGNILTVTSLDLLLMAILAAVVLLLFFTFYQDIKAYLFDETFSAVSGLCVRVLEYLILGLVALSVVVLLRVTGIMLAIALLAAPAATAATFTRRLFPRMLSASAISVGCSLLGLVLSFYLDIPSGATIVATAVLAYGIAYAVRALCARKAA